MRYYGSKLILNWIGQILYYHSQFISSIKVLWCTAYNLSVCELFDKLIIVVYSCISYTGFDFSVFSLTHWCSCHIHHQIRCCVVLLSGTIWRYGCEKAGRFIKHNNIFSTLSSMHTTHLISLWWWVDCCMSMFANLLFSELLMPWINQLCLFTHISTFVSKKQLRDLSWHVLITNSEYWYNLSQTNPLAEYWM